MSKPRYWDEISHNYVTEEEMEENAYQYLDIEDMEAALEESEYTMRDIFNELARLDSPLYWELMEAALGIVKRDFFCFMDEEEEEEND